MSQTFADNLIPASTGYDLGSASARWDAFLQDLDVSGTAAFVTLNLTSLEGIQFADQAAGATVTNKIDAALTAATNVLVLVPSTMGVGNATTISTGKSIVDFRGGLPKFFTSYSVSSAAWQINDAGTTIMAAMASNTANVASAGQVRLASADTIKFRNNGNSADILGLSKNASDVVQVGDTAGAKVAGPLAIAGALSGVTTMSVSGQITSTLASGTAPLVITSTDVVANLNVATLNGVTVSGAAAASKVLTASSASAASWQTPASASTVVILNKQDVLAAKTGDSTDQTVYTYSMPSGTLAASKGIRVTAFLSHNTGVAAVTYKIKFGATTVLNTAADASTGNWSFREVVFNNTGSTTAQWAGGEVQNPVTPFVGVQASSPAENTNSGSPIVITLTFNVANTDTVIPKGWLVELIN